MLLLNSDRKIMLIDCVSYVIGKTKYAHINKTAEMPRELRCEHVERKSNHKDCVGIRIII